MNTQNIFALLLTATSVVFTACGTVVTPEERANGSHSVTLDFPGISSDLRKNVKLVYNLSCAKDKSAIRAAKPVTATDESPDPAKVTLKFKTSEVAVGDYCALEALAADPKQIKDGAYRWLSKQQKVGLFYASEPAQVAKGSKVELVMHVLYEDKAQLDLKIIVASEFSAMGIGEIENTVLICGGISYVGQVHEAKDSVFKLSKKDFEKGQICKVKLYHENEVTLSVNDILVKSDTTDYKATFLIEPGEVSVVTSEGEKCAFDVETMKCVI